MPNHITNIITAPAVVLDAIKGPESVVDFNTLIPMPESLHRATSDGYAAFVELVFGRLDLSPPPIPDRGRLFSSGGMAAATANMKLSNVLRSIKEGGISKCTDEEFENFILMLRNQRAHGCATWYEWATDNWGTKWNAYGPPKRDGNTVRFDTAWAAPHPVIESLSRRFPDATITHQWADEDIGSNCGTREYCRAEFTETEPDDPVDFALTVKGRDREYYRKNPESGKWEYHDDEEANDKLCHGHE